MESYRNARTLLATPDEGTRARYEAMLHSLGARLVGCARTGREALELTEAYCPDVALVSLVMPEYDAQEMVKRLARTRLPAVPAVVLMAVPGMRKQAEALKRLGVYGAVSPFSGVETLRSTMEALRTEDRLDPEWATGEAVFRLLTEMDVPMSEPGYNCVHYAVWLTLRNSALPSRMAGELCPAVARRFDLSARTAERLMKRTLEAAWAQESGEAREALFGHTRLTPLGRPTVAEFVARVAEAIRMEEW